MKKNQVLSGKGKRIEDVFLGAGIAEAENVNRKKQGIDAGKIK